VHPGTVTEGQGNAMTAAPGDPAASPVPPAAKAGTAPSPAAQDKAAASPDKATEAPAAPIGTGFPEPVTPGEPRVAADGKVILATARPYGSLTLPPLEPGGETTVITGDGTEVDEKTAQRAREAAHLAGFRLTEL
jgi:hypothetical protein